MIRPDDICKKYSNKGSNLKIYKIDDSIVIEGDENSLIFLSELIHSVANDELDNNFNIHPNGAGKLFFNKTSDYGLIIHKKNK